MYSTPASCSARSRVTADALMRTPFARGQRGRCPIEWSSVPMPAMTRRLLQVLIAGFLTASHASAPVLAAVPTATFKKAELDHRFLLQVSYEQKSGLQDFRTSRSRIVTFHRDGAVLDVFDVSDTRGRASNDVFATIPIRDEDRDTLSL